MFSQATWSQPISIDQQEYQLTEIMGNICHLPYLKSSPIKSASPIFMEDFPITPIKPILKTSIP